MTLFEFNHIPWEEAFNALFSCCGSTNWANQLVSKRPVKTIEELKSLSNFYWSKTEEKDWLEAFSHHPKIGDLNALEKKFASTAGWASNEQSSVNKADITVLKNLSQGNDAYWQKFGFIFIVCATGKTAIEMLDLLNLRIVNSREVEIKIAAAEQNKITNLRIDKLFT